MVQGLGAFPERICYSSHESVRHTSGGNGTVQGGVVHSGFIHSRVVHSIGKTITSRRIVSMAAKFDAIVVGTGQSGPSMASRLSSEGLKVAVIERQKFGGTCVNTG